MRTVAIGLCLAFVGCGGGGVAPATYVKAVCTSAGTWQKDIERRALSLASELGGTPTPVKGKQAFGDFLDDLITSTDTLIGKVQDAGAPDIEDGDKAAAQLVTALNRVREAFQSARTQVAKASTESIAAFEQDASQINTSIQSALTGIDDPFAGSATELKSIFENDPACKDLAGS
jgi:hypothetical protein